MAVQSAYVEQNVHNYLLSMAAVFPMRAQQKKSKNGPTWRGISPHSSSMTRELPCWLRAAAAPTISAIQKEQLNNF